MCAKKTSMRRRCRSCRCLFVPDRRVGERQRYCGKPACQSERHRQACKAWHRKNPEYNKDARLRRRLLREKEKEREREKPKAGRPAVAATLDSDPFRRLDFSSVRSDLGSAAVVVFEEVTRVGREWTREAVRAELARSRGPPL
jgi:hypothetical protein